MAWNKPEYSRNQVNKAGKTLINPRSTDDELDDAYQVINNWRTSHNFPLNTFQIRLRRLAKSIDNQCLVAQRVKRLSSIKSKLQRIKGLNLAQIQDIGGCRAIVKNKNELYELLSLYTNKTFGRGLKHELFSVDDYVFDKPRPSGYRSVHLVYKYLSDKSKHYNNLKIEIQLRTQLQHAWATAVETIDTFTGQTLKIGGGEPDWINFFALISSYIAIKEETPVTPNTPDDVNLLREEIIRLESKLGVVDSLEAFKETLKYTSQLSNKKGGYFLLVLDPIGKSIEIESYPSGSRGLNRASNRYIQYERLYSDEDKNIVLVSADNLDTLKLTYPNYYADTYRFLNILNEVIIGRNQLSLFNL